MTFKQHEIKIDDTNFYSFNPAAELGREREGDFQKGGGNMLKTHRVRIFKKNNLFIEKQKIKRKTHRTIPYQIYT